MDFDLSAQTLAAVKHEAATHRTEKGRGTLAKALEAAAHQRGARDWNTLTARLKTPTRINPQDRIAGRYLGHPFKGHVHHLDPREDGTALITIKFDEAIDVIQFEGLTALRRRITKVIAQNGCSFEKTSDGAPHLVLLSPEAAQD
ncbi:MAG: glyoxalase superfamily protein [Pseudomonadota bacterium]